MATGRQESSKVSKVCVNCIYRSNLTRGCTNTRSEWFCKSRKETDEACDKFARKSFTYRTS